MSRLLPLMVFCGCSIYLNAQEYQKAEGFLYDRLLEHLVAMQEEEKFTQPNILFAPISVCDTARYFGIKKGLYIFHVSASHYYLRLAIIGDNEISFYRIDKTNLNKTKRIIRNECKAKKERFDIEFDCWSCYFEGFKKYIELVRFGEGQGQP